MGYVPEFDSDVFVSYATANNQELTAGKPAWVSSFRNLLEKLLDEGLDRRNASKVWMDDRLRGNEPFDEQLRDNVTRSAVLLIVMSEAYLASPWCRKELEIFLGSAQNGTDRTGCIFLVHYEPVPVDRWPNGLRGLSDEKYRFFQQERAGDPSIPLGFPTPNPDHHPSYYSRFIELRSELRARLVNMKAAKPSGVVAASEKLDGSGNGVQPAAGNGPAVYLAEVSGETLYDQRRMVKSHLEQVQIHVLPAKAYRRTPGEYTHDLDSDLAQCSLFVQMLGRFPTGQEGLQHERALAAGKEILRWRSRDLKLSDVPDAAHQDLLSGIDVKEMDFDELKRSIVQRTKMLSPKRPDRPEGDGLYVLVNSYTDDPLADAIVTQLEAWEVGSQKQPSQH
jgi:hypothetical protein